MDVAQTIPKLFTPQNFSFFSRTWWVHSYPCFGCFGSTFPSSKEKVYFPEARMARVTGVSRRPPWMAKFALTWRGRFFEEPSTSIPGKPYGKMLLGFPNDIFGRNYDSISRTWAESIWDLLWLMGSHCTRSYLIGSLRGTC